VMCVRLPYVRGSRRLQAIVNGRVGRVPIRDRQQVRSAEGWARPEGRGGSEVSGARRAIARPVWRDQLRDSRSPRCEARLRRVERRVVPYRRASPPSTAEQLVLGAGAGSRSAQSDSRARATCSASSDSETARPRRTCPAGTRPAGNDGEHGWKPARSACIAWAGRGPCGRSLEVSDASGGQGTDVAPMPRGYF